MDVPIAIGILAGFAWGAVNTVRGARRDLLRLGDRADLPAAGRPLPAAPPAARRRRRDRAAVLAGAVDRPRWSRADAVREVPVEALAPGTLVEVRAGDSMPADGIVVEGRSTLDLSLLTGESRPVAVAAGRPGPRRAPSTSPAALRGRGPATGEDTRVGRLMRLVEEGARRRAPVVRLADRISGWFVAAVLALAAATLVVWLWLDPGARRRPRDGAADRHLPVRARAGHAAGGERPPSAARPRAAS